MDSTSVEIRKIRQKETPVSGVSLEPLAGQLTFVELVVSVDVVSVLLPPTPLILLTMVPNETMI